MTDGSTAQPAAAHSWPAIEAAASELLAGRAAPQLGIVLGSGLGALSDRVRGAEHVAFSSVLGMPQAGVLGHEGKFVFGELGGMAVVCSSGRVHLYEGHTASEVVHGVRLMAKMGVGTVLLTNAAGGISEHCAPGNLMLIRDHINFTGHNPLAGPGLATEQRFVDMSQAYDARLGQLLSEVAAAHSISLVSGVYAGMLGPSYETPAEVRMLSRLGADAVGMSTVLETLALRQLEIRVVGLSCISNWAAGISAHELSHHDVAMVASSASETLSDLIESWAGRLAV